VVIDRSSSILAIVPARGGSKGIPGKNMKLIAGRPLLWWSIDAVDRANAEIRLVVSTDDPLTADLALRCGAEVVKRPDKLARDDSPTDPSLLHVLDELPNAERAHTVMLLQATSPVRLPGSIDSAIERYLSCRCDSLVGVVIQSPFVWIGPETEAKPLYDVDARPRRQDVGQGQQVYREIGNLYMTSIQALRQTGNRISGRVVLHRMSAAEGIDIDTQEDFDEAERVLAGLQTGPSS
jgi:CMP-N,N'-diacetyllegionaminic acid synthase